MEREDLETDLRSFVEAKENQQSHDFSLLSRRNDKYVLPGSSAGANDEDEAQDGGKSKTGGTTKSDAGNKNNQFFRVPKPPSQSKKPGSFLLSQRNKEDYGNSALSRATDTVGSKVQNGVTTGVELVLLLANQAPKHKKDDLQHDIYYLVESEPENVIQRNPYELVVVRKEDCKGRSFHTITKSGVTEFSKTNGTETTSLMEWLKYRNMFNLIHKDPFKFPLMKAFKTYKAFSAWKCAARIWKMESAREKLKVNLFVLNPQFTHALLHVREVTLSCSLDTPPITIIEEDQPQPLKPREEEKLLSGFQSAIDIFQSNTLTVEALGKRLHQSFIEGNRQIEEILAHVQMIVNTICQEFNDIQFNSDREQDWIDKISDVDMTVRDIKFMFPQRGRRNRNNLLNENIVEIFSKSQNQQKLIINFVRLVEVMVASAIASVMTYTIEQIQQKIVTERRTILSMKASYKSQEETVKVSVHPSVSALVRFFTKPFRDMNEVSTKVKRPLVFPLTKNNDVPLQFQRKNFVPLKSLVHGFGVDIDAIGMKCEAHVLGRYKELGKVNKRILSIPESTEFAEAIEESKYISSGKVEELKLNPQTFSKNLILIRDWLDLIEGSSSESQMEPLSLEISDLKATLHEELTSAYNLFVDRLHECLHFHSRHILDEMVYNSYDIKTNSEDLQLFVEECVRVEKDNYSTEERVQIIRSFFESLKKVLKYVDQSDSFNQELEEKFTTAEILMNELERLLRNKIKVSNSEKIKKQWSKFLDAKSTYKKTLLNLSSDIVNHSNIYINQLQVTMDCFCEEVQTIKEKLFSNDSADTSESLGMEMQREISYQLMKIETEIKQKAETSDNIQEMLDWWLAMQKMLENLHRKDGNILDKSEDIKESKEKGKALFQHVNSIFHWKKKFWLSDIVVWMEIYEKLTAIRPFSSELSKEILNEVNGDVEGHIGILNQRLEWATNANFVSKETKLISEIISAGKAWINTLHTFDDMISNPNQSSSVQLRHRLTVEMKRKGKSLLECTLADVHGRSASGFSLEKTQVKAEEDTYGKALFDLFHIERQMRSTYFMVNSRVSSNGSIHIVTNFMEIFQVIEKAEQVVTSTVAIEESLNASDMSDMGENKRELKAETTRVSSILTGIRYGIEVLYQAQCYYLLFSRLSNSVSFFKCAGLGFVNDCIYIKQRWQDEIIGPLTSEKQISILSASEEMEIKLKSENSSANLFLTALHELYAKIVEADKLQVARESYPRLYFIPDSILLHSIAYEDDPPKLLRDFFKLCFTGVAKVDIEESEMIVEGSKNQAIEIQEKYIKAIHGDKGERIELKEPILFSHIEGGGILSKQPQTKADTKPDELTVWAEKLELEIKKTMKALLSECHDEVNNLQIDQWLQAFPLQCIWLVNEIAWVKHIETQLSNSDIGAGKRLNQVQEQMSKKIHGLANKLTSLYPLQKEFKIKIRKIESLVHSGICHRDIAQHLIDNKVEDVNDFAWQRFIRYYWNATTSCCLVTCGSSMEVKPEGFEYGFEYLGENFALDISSQGLSLNSNAVLALAHSTFGTASVTPVTEVFGASFEEEVVRAVSLLCGQHLVIQDTSEFSKSMSKDSWGNFFLACKSSKSWMHLLGVDWFDISLVSKIICALDEVRMKISADLTLSKDCSAVKYFIPADSRFEARYRNQQSPLEKVARRICVIDWSFQIAFEAAIELKLRKCGHTGDTPIARELATVVSSVVKVMQKYVKKDIGMESTLTISKHIVRQLMTHDMGIVNCRFVILNAIKRGFGQFLPARREKQLEDVYWQLIAGHSTSLAESESFSLVDMHTETDLDLDKYLQTNQLENGYAFYSSHLKQKCLQVLDAISEDNKSIVVVGNPGSGKSAIIKVVFKAFGEKVMKNKNSVGRIYTDVALEEIDLLVSNEILIGTREAHKLKLLLVETKYKEGSKTFYENIKDQNVVLDGELSNPATLRALSHKASAETKGYQNLPRFIAECVCLKNVAPNVLTSMHMVHCGQVDLLSIDNYWHCSLESFQKAFPTHIIVKSLSVHEKLKSIELPGLLMRYANQHTVINHGATKKISDVFKMLKIFFDMFGFYLKKYMDQVETMASTSIYKTEIEIIRLIIFCIAWAVETQMIHRKGDRTRTRECFDSEIAQPILQKLLPEVAVDLDISRILQYDIWCTSNGHFSLALIEDPSGIVDDLQSLGMVEGLIVTKKTLLHRKMLLQWIDVFQYDVLLLGNSCSPKWLLMSDVGSKSQLEFLLPNQLHEVESIRQTSERAASDGVSPQCQLVIIEDLHVSQNVANALSGQERLRKVMDTKLDVKEEATSTVKQQFLCSSSNEHFNASKGRFPCSDRLHHHFYGFQLESYEEEDLSSIFCAEIHYSICTQFNIQDKELMQESQTLIMCVLSMTFDVLESIRVSLTHSASFSPTMLSQMYKFLELSVLDVIALDEVKVSDIKEWGRTLTQNMGCLSLQSSAYKQVNDTISAFCNDPTRNFLKDSPAIIKVAGDITHEVEATECSARDEKLDAELIFGHLKKLCETRGWLPSEDKIKSKDLLEIKFWSQMLMDDLKVVLKHLQFKTSWSSSKVLIIEYSNDIKILGHSVKFAEIVASVASAHEGKRKMFKFEDAKGQDALEYTSSSSPENEAVLFLEEKDLKGCIALQKHILGEAGSKQNKKFSPGALQIIVQCEDVSSFLRSVSEHAPSLLRVSEVCSLYQELEHKNKHFHDKIEKVFYECYLEISNHFSGGLELSSETRKAFVSNIVAVYQRSLQWNEKKQSQILKDRPAGKPLHSLCDIFEHTYISAWLLLHCWHSNTQAQATVLQQMTAMSNLDTALNTATIKYNEVQQVFEMTLDMTSSLLLSIAQQMHIIEQKEFGYSAEEYTLNNKMKRLESGKKRSQGRIEISYQNFLKGVEDVLQVSEMEIEEVRMNSKPPKLIQRLARACALVLALNLPTTKLTNEEVSKIKSYDWSELNAKLFSRIRVYDQSNESRISFFKREIDTFDMDGILDRLRNHFEDVREGFEELTRLLLMPDFKLNRVDQVSKALKPLCAWILAVHEYLKESLELDRLQVEHDKCESEVQIFKNLNAMKRQDELRQLKEQLSTLKRNYEVCSKNFAALEVRKRNLEYYIETCKLLIAKVSPWRLYCQSALEKLKGRKEILNFEIAAAGSIVVYASSLDKMERDHLKKCWGKAFKSLHSDDSFEELTSSCSCDLFNLHDFLRRNFTHEWFLEEKVSALQIMDIYSQSTETFSSHGHVSESIAIAWLALRALEKNCIFIDPDEVGLSYIESWRLSQEHLPKEQRNSVPLASIKIDDINKAEAMVQDSSLANGTLIYVQSTSFPYNQYTDMLSETFGSVHFIDLTLKDPHIVEQYICTLMSKFCLKSLPPLVSPKKEKLPIKERQEELQMLILKLNENKRRLCKTLTDESYQIFISKKDDDLSIDIGKVQELKADFLLQLEDYGDLTSNWQKQQGVVKNYFNSLPTEVMEFAKSISNLYCANAVKCGYFHSTPLTQFINVLERKLYGKLPVNYSKSSVEKKKAFFSGTKFLCGATRSMFDMLITNRYAASEWIIKSMHFAFHFEYLNTSFAGKSGQRIEALKEEEWSHFLTLFLKQSVSSEGVETRINLAFTAARKGWDQKISKSIEVFREVYSGSNVFEVVETVFNGMKKLHMEISIEDLLDQLDKELDSESSSSKVFYWRFAVVLFLVASSHREEELIVLWLMKQLIAMDYSSSNGTNSIGLAEQLEQLDNRIPLLLASPVGNPLQLVEQAATRYSMSFQKITNKQYSMKRIWQIAAAKSVRNKKLHTQEVKFVSIYHLSSLSDEVLDNFLFRNVEDGYWLVILDIDIENSRHRQICKMYQEIIAPQLFLSPPKSRFKLILCMDSSKGVNPYLYSVNSVTSKPNPRTVLDISFFACKCLPYLCSGAMWQQGEVVGIHDKTSITSPSLLSSRVLDLFEAYQSHVERSLHEAGKSIKSDEERYSFQAKTPALLTEENELGAAWRGYSIIIAIVQTLVADRHETGCGIPKAKRHMVPSHFEFIAGVQAIKTWLDALMGLGMRSLSKNTFDSSPVKPLERILRPENIKNISNGIIGTVYGPLYGCVVFNSNPEESSKVTYQTEDYLLMLWNAMFSRYFTYDIVKPNFMYKLATVGSMLTKPKAPNEQYYGTQAYPIRAMAKAGNSLMAIGDFVDTVLALPADSLSSISDLSSVSIGQVTFFKRNEDFAHELHSMKHLLLHKTILPISDYKERLETQIADMREHCESLYCKLQQGQAVFAQFMPGNGLTASMADFLNAEFESFFKLLYGVLSDLSLLEEFADRLTERCLSDSSYEAYLLLCISINYVPYAWKTSKLDQDTCEYKFPYSNLSSWLKQISEMKSSLLDLCSNLMEGQPKLHVDLRRVVNPKLFFDSMRLGFFTNSQNDYPTLKYDFISDKLFSQSPDITRSSKGCPDIIVHGISVSNAIWNEITQQLQDFRIQLDVGSDTFKLDEQVECSRLLPPFRVFPSSIGIEEKVDLPSTSLFHKGVSNEEYCDMPVVLSCMNEELVQHTDHLVCTLRLPSRRSTSYWLRKGTTGFIHRS